MDQKLLLDGLVSYLCFIPVLTFHEFAHAWTASRCGDDTAKNQGRVTLNPVAHIDLLGTIVLPLAALFLSVAGSDLGRFVIGWGKPVPVNVANLRRPRRDDTLVALAGPAMNVLLALGVLAVARMGQWAQSPLVVEMMFRLSVVSLFLCFFNLLPVPPLDGSHLVKNLIGMSDELYFRLSAFGFVIVILLLQVPWVMVAIGWATQVTLLVLAAALGFRV